MINYLFEATEIEDEKLIKAFTHTSEQGKEIAMTTADKLRHEGLQRGLQRGREEGLMEGLPQGKFTMMIDTIRNAKKNGLPDDMIAKIVNLDLISVRKIINNESIDIPFHLLKTRE